MSDEPGQRGVIRDRFSQAKQTERDQAAPGMRDSVRRALFGGAAQPTTIGRYVIETLLGSGGTGVVYRGIDPELGRAVAIKVLRHRAARLPTMRDRMVREARALARLNHPHVVTIYDVGVHEDQVFLVMALVTGGDLRRWLGRARRSSSEILEVFLQAGRGLAAAHEAGLIHRDFKPANVLLSEGRALVADFGLVVADSDPAPSDDMASPRSPLSPDSVATETGVVLGTPAYMAPEQRKARLVDASTDQFSYCIALWEALYGSRPEVPYEPSPAIRLPETATKVPARIRRALERGLALEPDQRWPTMNALLAALEGRGRKNAVGLAAAVVTVGLAAWGFLSPANNPCESVAEPIAGLWTETQKSAVERSFTNTGLVFAPASFAQVDATVGGFVADWAETRVTTCRAFHVEGAQSAAEFDGAMTCLDRSLDELRALLDVFERADASMVERAVAAVGQVSTPQRCRDIEHLSAAFPPPDAAEADAVANARRRLGGVQALNLAGDYAGASALAHEVIAGLDAVHFQPVHAEALLAAGTAASAAGQKQMARTELTDAYWTAQACGHELVAARAAAGLAYVARILDAEIAESAHWARTGESHVLRTAAAATPEHAAVLQQVAGVAFARGQLGPARDAFARAVEILAEHYGADSMQTLAARARLGNIYVELMEADRAESILSEVLEATRASVGDQHPRVGDIMTNLARALAVQGRDADAREMQRRSLHIYEALGADNVRLAGALGNAGRHAMNARDLSTARAMLTRGLEIGRRSMGEVHPKTAIALSNLAELAEIEGNLQEANALAAEAAAIRERIYGPDHEMIAYSRYYMARIARRMGEHGRAVELASSAVAIVQANRGTEHIGVASARTELARSLLGAGKPAEALAEAEQVLSTLDALGQLPHLAGASALAIAAHCALDLGHEDQAIAFTERVLARQPTAVSRLRPADRFQLARVLMVSGQRSRAHELAAAVLEELREGPSEPALTAEIERWLARNGRFRP